MITRELIQDATVSAQRRERREGAGKFVRGISVEFYYCSVDLEIRVPIGILGATLFCRTSFFMLGGRVGGWLHISQPAASQARMWRSSVNN